MGLEWGPEQIAVASLDKAGKTEAEIVKQTGYTRAFVNKVRRALKAGDKPPAPVGGNGNTPPAGTPLRTAVEIARTKPPKPPKDDKKEDKVTFTTEPLEAIALKLMNKTMVIYQTPQILFSYLCAVNRGFDVDLAEWITIACDDVWSGRNINYFEEVALKKRRSNGDGERQDQGVTETAGAEGE